MVARSRDKRRDDIAIPVAEGDDLIALDLLVRVEADVVAALIATSRKLVWRSLSTTVMKMTSKQPPACHRRKAP